MKGLILCGGRGTRLRPFTYSGAKHLMPVANKPVLIYTIESLKRAGIREAAVVVGDDEKEFRDKLGDGSEWGVALTYIRQQEPLGLAHGVKVAEGYINGEPFITVLGDNLIMHPFSDIIHYFKTSGAGCTILLSYVDSPERYGIATVEGGNITGLVEKPQTPSGNLGVVGIYAFNHKIFKAIERISPSERGELEISDAIMGMVGQADRVNYVRNKDWWIDIGRPEDLLEANIKMLSSVGRDIRGRFDDDSFIGGEVVLEEGAVIRGSVIRGPVVVGRGVVAEDSYIGPYTAVGENCRLINSEVEASVLMEGCLLKDVSPRIEMSIIGNGSTVMRRKLPRSIGVWVGKDSRVEIT